MTPETAPPEIEATEIVGRHFEETLARIKVRRKEVAAKKLLGASPPPPRILITVPEPPTR